MKLSEIISQLNKIIETEFVQVSARRTPDPAQVRMEQERLLLITLRDQLDNLRRKVPNPCPAQLSQDLWLSIVKLPEYINLVNTFEERWLRIKDTSMDYTSVHPNNMNTPWIVVARGLEKVFRKPKFFFLFPNVDVETDAMTARPFLPNLELRHLVLTEEGNRFFSISGMVESKFGGIPRTDKFYLLPLRALSVRELTRIMRKRNDPQLAGIIKFLRSDTMGDWQTKGTFPRSVLSSLVKVIQHYFDEGKKNDFSQYSADYPNWGVLMSELATSLNGLYYEDAYHLYGFVFKKFGETGNQNYFLLDLLIKWQEGNLLNIKGMMEGIACDLARYDPSVILDVPRVEDIYPKMGPNFSLANLRVFIPELIKTSCDSAEIKQKLVELDRMIAENGSQASIVQQLHTIYRMRWNIIKGTPNDYTCLQDKINQWWIRLAQLLKGANWIQIPYYQYLMPTIEHVVDPITRESIDSYPLSYFLLASNDRELILLTNSEQRYTISNTFYNCNGDQVVPFNAIEQARLARSIPRFRNYLDLINKRNMDRPLRISTIELLVSLVNDCLFEEGLQAGVRYNAQQLNSAERAWDAFREGRALLPADELTNLKGQRICYSGFQKTVEQIILDVDTAVYNGCVAVAGAYFTQLIFDYFPTQKLTARIEGGMIPVACMRAASAEKVAYEYSQLSASDVLNRCYLIMLYSLTYVGASDAVSELVYWDMKSLVDPLINEIASLVKPGINTGDIRKAQHGYANAMMCANKALVDFKGACETKAWLEIITDADALTKAVAHVDYKVLFCRLKKYIDHPMLGEDIKGFLKIIMSTWLQENRSSLAISLRINVYFNRFCSRLPTNFVTQLYQELDSPIDGKDFYKSVSEFILLCSPPLTTTSTSARASRPLSPIKIGQRSINSREEVLALFKKAEGSQTSQRFFNYPTATNLLKWLSLEIQDYEGTPVRGITDQARLSV